MSIVVEGTEVLECGSVAKACLLLMGIIYAMNLSYPPKMKYTFVPENPVSAKQACSLSARLTKELSFQTGH